MAVSTTIYDINDNPWTLELTGTNTPDELILTQDGILIEYPKYDIEDPIIYPKFTFKFIGTPATIEQFGIIQEFNQPFKLSYSRSDVTYEWRGYLIDDIFNMPNTGYDEVIGVNAISQIEALKFRSFDLEDSDNLPSIQSTMNYILSNVYNTGISYNLSFTLGNLGYVLHTNWYDEENVPLNQLDVLKKIFQFYTLIFEQDLKQKITVSSYAQLYKCSTAIDYSTIAHKGINETYSTSENYLSASVVDSILKPEDVLVNLSTDQTNEAPYLYKVRTYYWSKGAITGARYKKKYRSWVNYETHLHVIEEDEFPGWTFPHYDIGGESVDEWWNSDKLIKGNNKMPIAGMYRVTFRSWNVGDTKSILAGIIDSAKGSEPNVATLTNIFLIKTFNRAATADSNPPVVVPQDMFHPFASFNNKITVTSDDYLLLSGMLGLAARWGDISAWEDHPDPNPYDYENCYEGGTVDQETVDDFFKGNITGINGEWADIAVPLINHTSLSLWWFFNRVKFVDCFKIQVKFKDLYWSAITEDWSPSPNTFSLPLETQGELEKIIGQIKTHYPPVHTPLYEELGQGYAIRFGERQDGTGTANTGTGTLSIKLFFGFTDIPLTIWLQNFNFNLVKAKDDINVVKTPQSPTYEYGNKKEPKYKQLTNYLMSSYENISSFSQVYMDVNGNTQLDALDYSLPNGTLGTSNFSESQKPEEHTLRIIKELISSRVVLDDVIDFSQFNDWKQVEYNNKLLVRDSYTIDALNNIVYVSWIIRKFNYT